MCSNSNIIYLEEDLWRDGLNDNYIIYSIVCCVLSFY